MQFTNIPKGNWGRITLLLLCCICFLQATASKGGGIGEIDAPESTPESAILLKDYFLTQLPTNIEMQATEPFRSLLLFEGTDLGREVLLNWVVPFSEKRPEDSYFEIQRSANGKRFESIGFAYRESSAGNNQWRSFEYRDSDPYEGENYYRLVQISSEEKKTYSDVVSTSRKDPASLRALIHAGTAKDDIHLLIFSNTSGTISVDLLDGRIAVGTQFELRVTTGLNDLHISPENVPPGFYNLIISGQGNQIIHKISLQEEMPIPRPKPMPEHSFMSLWQHRSVM